MHRDYIKSLSVGQAAVDGSLARVLGASLARPHKRPPPSLPSPHPLPLCGMPL